MSGARHGRRPRTARVVAGVLAVWSVAAVLVLAVAADTRVGPIVFNLSKGHGIHAGDLVALAVLSSTALLITFYTVRKYIR